MTNVSIDVDYRNLLADSRDTISLSDVSVEPADTDEVSDLCNHYNSHVHNYCVILFHCRVCPSSEMEPSGRE